MKWRLASALTPLLHESQIRMEVLCLGLEGTQSENIHMGILRIKINPRFEQLTSELRNHSKEWAAQRKKWQNF